MKLNRTFKMVLVFTLLLTGVHGCNQKAANTSGPPAGKTGNQWAIEDFAGSESRLALEGGPEFVLEGGPEFVRFCKGEGTCEIKGDVMEKYKEILGRYPVTNEGEYDHFAVVVRDGLIENGLLPAGDPDRYQYKIRMLVIHLTPQ